MRESKTTSEKTYWLKIASNTGTEIVWKSNIGFISGEETDRRRGDDGGYHKERGGERTSACPSPSAVTNLYHGTALNTPLTVFVYSCLLLIFLYDQQGDIDSPYIVAYSWDCKMSTANLRKMVIIVLAARPKIIQKHGEHINLTSLKLSVPFEQIK